MSYEPAEHAQLTSTSAVHAPPEHEAVVGQSESDRYKTKHIIEEIHGISIVCTGKPGEASYCRTLESIYENTLTVRSTKTDRTAAGE